MSIKPPSYTLSLDDFLRSIELQIRDLTIEIGVAVSLSKEILLVKQGEVSRISFSEKEKTKIKNSIFTHNHPSNFPHSKADLSAAYEYNLVEIRVVTNEKIYVVKPTQTEWKSFVEVERLYNLRINNIISDYHNGYISEEEALYRRQHIGLYIAEELGYEIKIIEL
jgi:hypothetical protein